MHAFDDRHISTTLLKSLRYLRARYETAHHCIAIPGTGLVRRMQLVQAADISTQCLHSYRCSWTYLHSCRYIQLQVAATLPHQSLPHTLLTDQPGLTNMTACKLCK